MKTVGIIGGGQLGFYLGLTAHRMGIEPAFLDSNPVAPAKYITNNFICASFDDFEAVKKLSEMSDVVTYEFENVDLEVIKKINQNGKVPQGHIPLEISNDRLIEKNKAKEIGVKTPKFREINTKEDLLEAFKEIPKGILKTRRFGYDGKGQVVINDLFDLADVESIIEAGAIAEKMIDLDY